MSGVSAGRLLMFTWKVISPASSFETAMLVMSGAAASSPTESLNVCEFAAGVRRPAERRRDADEQHSEREQDRQPRPHLRKPIAARLRG